MSLASVSLEEGQNLLKHDVFTIRLSISASEPDELGVDEAPVCDDVSKQSAVLAPICHVADENHLFAFDQLSIHFRGLEAVALVGLRGVDAYVSDALSPGYFDRIAVNDGRDQSFLPTRARVVRAQGDAMRGSLPRDESQRPTDTQQGGDAGSGEHQHSDAKRYGSTSN